MKKTAFVAVATCLVLLSLSCKKNTSSSNTAEALNLRAPSGQQVAASIEQLKAEAALVILFKHNAPVEFQLSSIEYLPVKKGYAAIISYTLQDGTTGKYGVFQNVQFNITAASGAGIVPPGENENNVAPGKATISCRGTCSCSLSATINTDTGIITVDCGCTSCGAYVTYSN
jgi:hypothetical protein